MTCPKIGYQSREQAARCRRRKNTRRWGKRLGVYQCQTCHLWHITSLEGR